MFFVLKCCVHYATCSDSSWLNIIFILHSICLNVTRLLIVLLNVVCLICGIACDMFTVTAHTLFPYGSNRLCFPFAGGSLCVVCQVRRLSRSFSEPNRPCNWDWDPSIVGVFFWAVFLVIKMHPTVGIYSRFPVSSASFLFSPWSIPSMRKSISLFSGLIFSLHMLSSILGKGLYMVLSGKRFVMIKRMQFFQ